MKEVNIKMDSIEKLIDDSVKKIEEAKVLLDRTRYGAYSMLEKEDEYNDLEYAVQEISNNSLLRIDKLIKFEITERGMYDETVDLDLLKETCSDYMGKIYQHGILVKTIFDYFSEEELNEQFLKIGYKIVKDNKNGN